MSVPSRHLVNASLVVAHTRPPRLTIQSRCSKSQNKWKAANYQPSSGLCSGIKVAASTLTHHWQLFSKRMKATLLLFSFSFFEQLAWHIFRVVSVHSVHIWIIRSIFNERNQLKNCWSLVAYKVAYYTQHNKSLYREVTQVRTLSAVFTGMSTFTTRLLMPGARVATVRCYIYTHKSWSIEMPQPYLGLFNLIFYLTVMARLRNN